MFRQIGFAVVAVAGLASISTSQGPGAAKPLTRAELNAGLATPIDIAAFGENMELATAVKLLEELVAKKGKRIKVVLNAEPDAGAPRTIRLPSFVDEVNPAATFTAKQILLMLSRRLDTVLLVKDGTVRFTTGEEVSQPIDVDPGIGTKKGIAQTSELGWFESTNGTAPTPYKRETYFSPEVPLEQKASLAEINEALRLPVEKSLLETYKKGDTFHSAFLALRKHAKSKGKKLPIFVDDDFIEGTRKRNDLGDRTVRIPEKTANATVAQFLRLALESCPDAKAVYVVSGGAVVIAHKAQIQNYKASK